MHSRGTSLDSKKNNHTWSLQRTRNTAFTKGWSICSLALGSILALSLGCAGQPSPATTSPQAATPSTTTLSNRVASSSSESDFSAELRHTSERAIDTTPPVTLLEPDSPKRPDFEPSPEEIAELLAVAQSGNADDLLAAIEMQQRERLPEIAPQRGVNVAGQGPDSILELDATVQQALCSAYSIDPNGEAVGRPNQGELENGVPLPHEPDLYTIRSRHASYASSHTALQVVTAFRNFRERTGYDGEITIGDISPRDGGSYRSHHSHQTGRDLDILMPLQPGTYRWGHNIDWDTTWQLVRSFLETGEVQYIFLDYDIQEQLHAAALRAGEDPRELSGLISWPRGIRAPGVIRNSPGHWAHFHVRIHCGPTETRCRSLH